MTVTPGNLVQGPANLWFGVFGVAEPTGNSQAPGAGWTDGGATDGGVDVDINQTFSKMSVDQIAGPVDSRFSDLAVTIVTNLAEPTLPNLRVAFNQAASAATTVGINPTLTGSSPNYAAVLVRGMRPGGAGPRTFILRRALMTANVKSSFKKDGKTLIPVTFEGFYVSQSILPFVYDDTP